MAVVSFGGLNYLADIEMGIESEEIVAINSRTFGKAQTASVTTAPASSKADELKKLKELLDSGALTQKEYDAEKKKILDKP